MDLKGTKTAENLLHSFAGESQARMRYDYYASQAEKDGYVQIRDVFQETARNEKEHAKRFFKFLVAGGYQGGAIEINAMFPVQLGTTAENLKAAAAGEHEEWTEAYPAFADIAEKEGFELVAKTFREIAAVEKAHEDRYLKLLENIEKEQVFKKDEVVLWHCLNCGYIYEGKEAPKACPACAHPQSWFEIWKETY